MFDRNHCLLMHACVKRLKLASCMSLMTWRQREIDNDIAYWDGPLLAANLIGIIAISKAARAFLDAARYDTVGRLFAIVFYVCLLR